MPTKKKSSLKKAKTAIKKTPEIIEKPKEQSTALTATDPVTRYMQEIRKYPLLSREEEEKIARRYFEEKDPQLAQLLVTSNLRFVVKVAAEYSKFGSRMIDLIQEGNVGLMHAVKEFNPYKGVKLITYAVWWIRGYIQEYLMRQYSLVRIGTTHNQRKLFYQLQKKREELERLGHEAGIAQLSGRLDIPEKEISEMSLRLSGKDISLSQPLSEGQSTSLIDMQTSKEDESVDEVLALKQQLSLLQEKIDDLRPELTEREIELLDNRLLADSALTLQEIGDRHGITREAVRQMEARLIKKIRDKIIS